MNATYEERKNIFEHIKLLVKSEQEEIFRIIRKTKDNYTENSNGIFFDLTTISDEAFNQIQEYISFCLNISNDRSSWYINFNNAINNSPSIH
jgi:dsDNA-specific endonuclease/ATPase MutS2